MGCVRKHHYSRKQKWSHKRAKMQRKWVFSRWSELLPRVTYYLPSLERDGNLNDLMLDEAFGKARCRVDEYSSENVYKKVKVGQICRLGHLNELGRKCSRPCDWWRCQHMIQKRQGWLHQRSLQALSSSLKRGPTLALQTHSDTGGCFVFATAICVCQLASAWTAECGICSQAMTAAFRPAGGTVHGFQLCLKIRLHYFKHNESENFRSTCR